MFDHMTLILSWCRMPSSIYSSCLYRISGVTRGVGARGQGKLTAPPKKLYFSRAKTDDLFLVVKHYASQFGATFPQLLTKLPLKPNFAPLCGPLDPQNISKYIPVA